MTPAARNTFLMYLGIMLAWTLTWWAKVSIVDGVAPFLRAGLGSFLWWTTAKLVIWILPAYWLISSGGTLGSVFNFSRWKSALAWGGSIGFLIALTRLVPSWMNGHALLPASFSIPLFSVLFIAPTFEEFLARGALMGGLRRGFSFWIANVISALMFLGMHIPGWYFMGTLAENISQPTGGALSILLLGLAFGYAVMRSRSVMGGMVAHFINNLASSA